MNAPRQTPQQLAESRRRDVMAYAYRDQDGKLYSIDASGRRIPAPSTTPALDAEHQRIAEQTEALVMSYDRILAVSPEARSFIGRIFQSGQVTRDEIGRLPGNIYAQARTVLREFGVDLPQHSMDLFPGGQTARQLGAGFSLIPNFIREAIASGRNVLGEFGSGQISRENAIAIGTAYASARQAAAKDRPEEIGFRQFWNGLFSASFFTYLSGLISWAADKAIGFLETLPLIGEWIKSLEWSSNLSFAEHIHGRARENDNDRVAREMVKLPRIGGVDTADLAPLLTRGGVVRTREGEREITPADRSNPAPTIQNQPTTPQAAVQPPGNLVDRATQAVNFSDTGKTLEQAGVTGVIASGVVTGQALRGVAEGVARSSIDSPERRAKSAASQEAKLRTNLERLDHATPRSSSWQFWRRTEEGIAAERTRLDARITETTGRYVEHSTTAQARAENAGRFTQTAMTPLREINKADDAGFLRRSAHRIWNAPRSLGRGVGYVAGMVAETADHYGGRVVERVGSVVARVPGVGPHIAERITPQLARSAVPGVMSVAGAAVDAGRGIASAMDGDGVAATTSAGHAVGGVLGTAAAVSAYTGVLVAMGAGAKAGAAGGTASGFLVGGVGAIPGGVIGAVGGALVGVGGYYAGHWAFGNAANDVGRLVFGGTQSQPAPPTPSVPGGLTVEMIPAAPQPRMSAQLRALVEANQARLAAQTALEAATRAVIPDNPGARRNALEAAEARLMELMEKMNPAQVATLLAEIRTLAQSGIVGTPDAGLTAAAVDAHTRAQREAGVVIMEARTALGAVIPGNGDTTPPTRPAALPIPPVAERGMSELITF
jgi:hypothetical protein